MSRFVDAGILGAMMFQLLFRTQDDRYEPEFAPYVIDAISALDSESAAIILKLASYNVTLNLN